MNKIKKKKGGGYHGNHGILFSVHLIKGFKLSKEKTKASTTYEKFLKSTGNEMKPEFTIVKD